MLRYIVIFSILLNFSFAEDKPGESWKAWKKLEEVILANKEQESLALLSGRMKDGFFRFGMTNINNEVRNMEAKFVREFPNDANNTRFLVIDVKGELRTLMFIKEGKEWLFDEQVSEAYTSAEDAAIGLGQFIAQQQLQKVYGAVVSYCNTNNIKRIPPPEEMKFAKDLLKYRDPASGKLKNIHLVRNVDFVGNFNLLLAVTENIIGAAHHAIFEDNHLGTVTKEQFAEHKDVLGLGENASIVLTEKEIEKWVKQLGAAKSKDRKEARDKLLQLDENALKVLVKHRDSDDLEIKLSMKEIIEAISKKSSTKRPKL